MQTRPLTQKLFDLFALVRTSSVPKQNHLPSEMPEEVAQKLDDFDPGNVGDVKAEIKAQMLIRRRNAESRDRRDPVAPVAMAQDRCATSRCPGLSNMGNEQKPTFVKKRKVSPQLLGFFLYAAISSASTGRWLPRRVPAPDVLASDNSTPTPLPAAAIPLNANTEPQNAFGSGRRYVSTSTGLSHSRREEVLSPRTVAVSCAVRGRAAGGVQGSAATEVPSTLPAGTLDASVPRSLGKPLRLSPPGGSSCPPEASKWPDVFASLTVGDFLEVSCPRL